MFKVVSWLPNSKVHVESKSPMLIQRIQEGEASRKKQEEIVRCIREDKALPLHTSKQQAKIILYSVKSEAAIVARAALHEVCWILGVHVQGCVHSASFYALYSEIRLSRLCGGQGLVPRQP